MRSQATAIVFWAMVFLSMEDVSSVGTTCPSGQPSFYTKVVGAKGSTTDSAAIFNAGTLASEEACGARCNEYAAFTCVSYNWFGGSPTQCELFSKAKSELIITTNQAGWTFGELKCNAAGSAFASVTAVFAMLVLALLTSH